MNLKKISTLCLAASTLVATSSAMAWESADGAWSTSASVALSSEYVWRGITQTDSDPAISGSFDVGHSSGAYAGAWASNVDFGDDASLEIDYYAGFASDIAETGVSYDLGVIYYDYPGVSELNYDFTELYGSLSYSFLTAGVAYTVDADNKAAEDNVYYSLDAGYDIGAFSLAAGVGYYDFDAGGEYTNYHVGASTELAGFGLDLTYSAVDNDGEALGGDDQFIFTISKSL
tara:strand:+ start:123400 stop:124092 length:693 start_codon:yes stop_codon:yes gene_type:complete